MKGARLKELREERGLNQAQLAKKLHISASAIGMYETDKRDPSDDMKLAIANFFGVSVDYLMGMTDIREPSTDQPLVAFESGLEGLTEEQKKIIMDLVENMKNSNK